MGIELITADRKYLEMRNTPEKGVFIDGKKIAGVYGAYCKNNRS